MSSGEFATSHTIKDRVRMHTHLESGDDPSHVLEGAMIYIHAPCMKQQQRAPVPRRVHEAEAACRSVPACTVLINHQQEKNSPVRCRKGVHVPGSDDTLFTTDTSSSHVTKITSAMVMRRSTSSAVVTGCSDKFWTNTPLPLFDVSSTIWDTIGHSSFQHTHAHTIAPHVRVL